MEFHHQAQMFDKLWFTLVLPRGVPVASFAAWASLFIIRLTGDQSESNLSRSVAGP